MRDLDHPIRAGVENTDSWRAKKGDLQHAFPLYVPMVTSPKLSFVANDNNLTDIGLALGETIHFSSLGFTANCLGHLSLPPYERDSSVIFIEMVHSGTPLLHNSTSPKPKLRPRMSQPPSTIKGCHIQPLPGETRTLP
jgi:hypothetical protein